MPLENLKPQEAKHIRLFIKHFVVTGRQGRWKTILSMKPEKWVGTSAYDCNQPEYPHSGRPISRIIDELNINNYLDREAYVFHIGHGAGAGVRKGTLRSTLLEGHPPLECVISIIPGKLAVSFGHGGEFRLCKRT